MHWTCKVAAYLIVSYGQLGILVVLVTGDFLLWKGHDPDLTSLQGPSLASKLYQGLILMPSHSTHLGQPLELTG